MPNFFQEVFLPEHCFLSEALLWVAFQRLPIAEFDDDGVDIRDSRENYEYDIATPGGPLRDDECSWAKLPPDPHFLRMTGDSFLEGYRALLIEHGHEEAMRMTNVARDNEDVEFKRACAEWRPLYESAIEYPATQVFVALRGGRLRTSGRLLSAADPDIDTPLDVPRTEIPSSFWTLKGINFDSSSAQNGNDDYCHIVVRTDDLLAEFPGERDEITVERIGYTLVVREDGSPKSRSSRLRGRPPYRWEHFHLEVAALLQRNELPSKKEAAIQHFQTWFEHELNVRPSRAAIGEKLTPYYERFLRGPRQKI